MACAVPRWSRASAGQPRSPGAPADWSVVGGSKVLPPSRDRAVLISVVAPVRRPEHRHVRHRARARRHDGDPRRQLAAEPRFAGHSVDLHGRPEPRAAIAADRDKHVGPAVARRAPRDGDEGAVGRHPGRGIRAPRKASDTASGGVAPWSPASIAVHSMASATAVTARRFPIVRVIDAPHPQNLTRAPNCSDRGSPTAVIWPNVGDGLPDSAGAEVRVPRQVVAPIGQVEPSASASS